MHEAAVANGCQQEWQSEIEAEDASAQGAIGECYGMARTEGDVLIHAAIFAQRDFAFRAPIQIVEDGPGHTPLGERTKVGNADDVW
jgi:hypothetical protein